MLYSVSFFQLSSNTERNVCVFNEGLSRLNSLYWMRIMKKKILMNFDKMNTVDANLSIIRSTFHVAIFGKSAQWFRTAKNCYVVGHSLVHLLIRSCACTPHSFPCSTLLTPLTRPAALICLLTRLFTHSQLVGKWMIRCLITKLFWTIVRCFALLFPARVPRFPEPSL